MAFAALSALLIMFTNRAPMALTALPALLIMFAKCATGTLPAVVALLAVRTLWHPRGFLCTRLPATSWVAERRPRGMHGGAGPAVAQVAWRLRPNALELHPMRP